MLLGFSKNGIRLSLFSTQGDVSVGKVIDNPNPALLIKVKRHHSLCQNTFRFSLILPGLSFHSPVFH